MLFLTQDLEPNGRSSISSCGCNSLPLDHFQWNVNSFANKTRCAQHSKTHSLFPHGQSQDDPGMGSQGSKMQGNILDVTLEIRASVQTWSSHILESRLLLVDRCLKNTLFFAFHSSKEHRFYSILFTESNRLLINPCLEVIFK